MLSIIVPVYNEEESLVLLYTELVKEMVKLKERYEIIFIDDGSIDNSLDILKKLKDKDKNIYIYSFRKNLGKADALTLGFQKSRGDLIITLDADLQDKPTEIYKLVDTQKMNNLDLVSGWRKNRKDKSKMVIMSKIFNYLAGKLFGIYLHDYNCGLKIYTREAAKSLNLYGGQHRFIPLLLHQQGYTVGEVVVEHEIRKYGKSKYGISKAWKDLPDIFTMLFLNRYSQRPLHFFGFIGGALSLTGVIILIYLTLVKILLHQSIGERPLLIFGVLLVISGLQTLFSGFLAELIISMENKEKIPYSLKYNSDSDK
jgi:glycosyltransferase involved in cell wall biosynthesis